MVVAEFQIGAPSCSCYATADSFSVGLDTDFAWDFRTNRSPRDLALIFLLASASDPQS